MSKIIIINNFRKLGHLVFQGTNSTNTFSDDKLNNYIKQIICKELFCKPLVVTCFESVDEKEMKDYLLFPMKRYEISKRYITIIMIKIIF